MGRADQPGGLADHGLTLLAVVFAKETVLHLDHDSGPFVVHKNWPEGKGLQAGFEHPAADQNMVSCWRNGSDR